jgi:hypothetical protein
MPSSLQYPLDRHRDLQRKWRRLLQELSPKAPVVSQRQNDPTENEYSSASKGRLVHWAWPQTFSTMRCLGL